MAVARRQGREKPTKIEQRKVRGLECGPQVEQTALLAAAAAAAAAAKSLQSCSTLCDSIGGSPLGFPVPGILQARTLEWVAISFSNA